LFRRRTTLIPRAGLLALALAMLATAAPPARAQQTEPEPTFPVKLVKVAAIPAMFAHGQAAVFHGTVDTAGAGFRVPGLTMLTPVAVSVFARDASKPIKLTLGKDWQTADRTVETGADGSVTEMFRTDDEARIHLSSRDGESSFDLVIWVGPERTDYPDIASAINFGKPEVAKARPATSAAAAGSATAVSVGSGSSTPSSAPGQSPARSQGTSPVLWIIAGLLGALVVIAGIAVLRRKR